MGKFCGEVKQKKNGGINAAVAKRVDRLSGPVVSDLLQISRALAKAKARSFVLNGTFTAAKLLGDEDVRVRTIELLKGIDLGR